MIKKNLFLELPSGVTGSEIHKAFWFHAVFFLWPKKLSMNTSYVQFVFFFSCLMEDFKFPDLLLDRPLSDQTQMNIFFFNLIFYFLRPYHAACRILVPQPDIEPMAVPCSMQDISSPTRH